MFTQYAVPAGRTRVLLCAAGAIVLTLSSGCSMRAVPRGRDRQRQDNVRTQAVRAVLDQQVSAWNRGDIDGFMDTYWRSDELTFSGAGQTRRGWAAVRDRYKARYRTPEQMGKLAFSAVEIRTLGSSAALVLGRWELTDTPEAARGVFTLVLQRIDGQWRIIHDHTSAEPQVAA